MPLDHLQTFRLALFCSLLGLMFLAESFYPVRTWLAPRVKRWAFHLGVTVFNTLLTRLLIGAPLLMLINFLEVKKWGFSHVLGLQGTAEIVSTIVLFDLFDYWWHRINHRIPFLWRFHRMHHSDTEVDVTTSLRFHPGELLLSYVAKVFWILFWGPSLAGFILFEAAITAYAQFHHSNIDFPDAFEKKLRWIHMTPRLHASHHTVSLRSRDANFSTIFLIWDKIFGTFTEADFEEMKKLGLPEGRATCLSPLDFLITPFRLKGAQA